MTKEQQQVREFHRVFGATINEAPTIPSENDGLLRHCLIAEELHEFNEARQERDLVDVADALADMLYVLLGTAVTYGIDLEPVFQEVHRSNMSKLWTFNELDTIAIGAHSVDCHKCAADVTACQCGHEYDVKAYVVKRKDGKALKSPSYQPANLAPIITAQINRDLIAERKELER